MKINEGKFLEFLEDETQPEPFHVTELAERLAGPDGAMVKKSLLSRLGELMPAIDQAFRAGLSRDAYRDAEMVKSALVEARKVIDKHPAKEVKLV